MPAIESSELQAHSRSLWLGVLSGPLIYALHFITVYLLVEVACRVGWLQFQWWGLSGLSIAVLAITVIAALLNAGAGLLAYRAWQGRQERGEGTSGTYAPLMSLVGIGLNALFTVTILVTGAPALVLLPCRWI
jgi:hypothetical protein